MHIGLSAGETSGDHLAAALARALFRRHDGLQLAGVAGPDMSAAGVRPLAGLDELDVMGLTEVIAHLPRLLRLRRRLERELAAWPARAFVGVDAPDFNLGLARRLRRRGVFSAQFVAPSVWAWRRYRIPKIARSLDLILTLFPFEPDLFRPAGLDAEFVGHPLADELPLEPDRAGARHALELPAEAPVVALLPGSRPGEIRRHAVLIAETARELARRHPDAALPVLLARAEHQGLFLDAAPAAPELRFIIARTRDGLAAADAAVAASGTVTLEALLLKTPTAAYYRLPGTTYWLARTLRLVRSRFVTLPNVLAGRELIPERIQAAATPARLADDASAWLDDADRAADFRRTALEIHQRLARGAAERAAEILLERIGNG